MNVDIIHRSGHREQHLQKMLTQHNMALTFDPEDSDHVYTYRHKTKPDKSAIDYFFIKLNLLLLLITAPTCSNPPLHPLNTSKHTHISLSIKCSLPAKRTSRKSPK